ncbi:MAG: AAA family ATPase [Firmicutes bacterium]|nr:AAA family ATPase [Bacillota bacterium]
MNKRQLRKINIKGFKSIKESSIDLNMLNVLIGSNGAGKSNFVSIFTLLNDIIKHELQTHVNRRGGAGTFLFNGPKITTELEIGFEFGENSYGFVLSRTDNDTLFFRDERFGYSGGFNHNNRLGSGHVESAWERGGSNKIVEYVQPILANQAWRVYHFHDTSRNARVKDSHEIVDNLFLQFDASNLAAFLLRLKTDFKESYDGIVKTIRLVAPYFGDFVLAPSNGSGKIILRWRQIGSEDIFNANQLSDGTLRFICLAVLLLQPKELQPETIIIDEPELGLHPFAITIFAELVKKTAFDKQIILSTQSVELLNEFEPQDIIVVDRNDDGSVFKRLDEEKLREWLESDYSLGELWKKNILGGRLSK